MFLNTLKYMNDSEDLIMFACVYCETFVDFIKVYEKELQYLLLDSNTKIIFCKSSMLFD